MYKCTVFYQEKVDGADISPISHSLSSIDPALHCSKQDSAGGDGKIFYQPDEADDFDEEDPDDDLDI